MTPRYAARVARVPAGAGGHGAPGTIMFGSGDAYPEGLPDVSELAQRAAVKYRTETLQYAPRTGLPELREWIAGHVVREGIRVGAESILVCNGAKQGIDPFRLAFEIGLTNKCDETTKHTIHKVVQLHVGNNFVGAQGNAQATP